MKAKKPMRLHKSSPSVMNFPVKLGESIHFPVGMPGFETVKDFQFRVDSNFAPFLFLDAAGESDVSFICIDTFYLNPDYEMNISPQTMDDLKVESLADVAVFSIVTVGESLETTTANLLSPLLINMKERIGTQVILENSNYPIRFPVMEEINRRRQDEKSS